MSILFDSDDGWIISHLDYMHGIYELVEDGRKVVKLEFNHKLFNVNSQYLRQNQVAKCQAQTTNDHAGSTAKRKNTHTLPKNILEQNTFIKETSEKLVQAARIVHLLDDTITRDNNEESRVESKLFYLRKCDPICNYEGRNERDKAIIADFQGSKYVFPRHCRFICNDVRRASERLESLGDYDLILVDPPWWNKSIRRKKAKFQESSYSMLYTKEIAQIPIKSLLNSNSIVAIWCTSNNESKILEELFPAWGLTYKAKWFWLKVTRSGYPICDFSTSHGKQPYEQLIFGTVASNKNLNLPDKKILVSIPSAVHSHKPPLTEILKPYVLSEQPKCIEIFARYLLPGWTSWGLEVLKFQHLSLFSKIDTECESNRESTRGN